MAVYLGYGMGTSSIIFIKFLTVLGISFLMYKLFDLFFKDANKEDPKPKESKNKRNSSKPNGRKEAPYTHRLPISAYEPSSKAANIRNSKSSSSSSYYILNSDSSSSSSDSNSSSDSGSCDAGGSCD